jgi:hypothetical protein
MKTSFTRKENSAMTEEEWQGLDSMLISTLLELGPYITLWLENVNEVHNYVNLPVYAKKGDAEAAFELTLKKPNCSREKICPFCSTPKVIDYIGKVE